jgi:predicted branched-subunit amino acid permease
VPYDWGALFHGIRAIFSLAGLVMTSSFIGFGALLHSMGLAIELGWYTTLFIWAMPGQVVYLTMLAQGASVVATALAVSLTAVRLMPMVMLILSKARQEGQPRWPEYVLAHCVAITLWVISGQSIEKLPRHRRLPWALGLGVTMIFAMVGAMTVGYYLADALPPILACAIIFLMPSFFGLSLISSAYYRFDYLAIALGAVLTPIGMLYFPQFDLLVAGLVGGCAAFLLGRPKRHRLSKHEAGEGRS